MVDEVSGIVGIDERASPQDFLHIARIIPSDQEVLTLPPDTKVREALKVMDERDFSQVPVVAGEAVIGVFSHRSLARGLAVVRRQDNPLDMAVDDLLEDLAFVRPAADVTDIIEQIERDNAVLIGEENNLLAIATAADVAKFLWDISLPYILIRDIELAVRNLIKCACPSEPELKRRILAALPERVQEDAQANLHDLTLGELLGVLIQGENFGQCFSRTFGRNRDLVRGLLEPVRSIRNRVFHFVGESSNYEVQTLLNARRWLERKVITVKAQAQ